MSEAVISYADVTTKQLVQSWPVARESDTETLVLLHFEERFGVQKIHVESAREERGNLYLWVITDTWTKPREFALSPEGSLMW